MKVAINGTGVAGPTLAYWLREYGFDPVLFEKAPGLRRGGYIVDFWGLGYDIAERMGVIDSLRERGYAMQRLRAVDAEGRNVATLPFESVRSALGGRFISIARGEIAATLFGACQGIPTRFGVSVSDVEQRPGGVVLSLSDGSEESFDLLIGADGLHSRVREAVFGPEQDFEHPLGCHVAAFRLDGYPRGDELTYVSHTCVGRQVARITLRGDATLVLLVCRSQLLDQGLARSDPKAALTQAFADMRWEVPEILSRMQTVEELYLDSVSQIRMPSWTRGRVALLGDAAACASLLAGEGTGLAMLEAYVLAGELKRAGGQHAHAFEAYERKLRAFLQAKQAAAPRLATFFAPKTRAALWARDWALKAAALPFFTKLFLASSLRDDFELEDYANARPSDRVASTRDRPDLTGPTYPI